MVAPGGLSDLGGKALIVLDPDFKIVDVSDAYRLATYLWNSAIIGASMFEVFPDNPADPAADGLGNLRTSLAAALRERAPQWMRCQRYDVRDRLSGTGEWIEKFWRVSNRPVFGSGSTEITHLIHEVVDITDAVHAQRAVDEELLVVAEMKATLGARERELLEEQKRVLATLRAPLGSTPSPLLAELAAHDPHRLFVPNEEAAVSGFYRDYHYGACAESGQRIFVHRGRRFPKCAACRLVVYRLVQAGAQRHV